MIHRLEADSVLLRFGSRIILSDVFIQCKTGQIVGLLGRNGQGKSCLFNAIFGTQKADHGNVFVDGHRQHYNLMRNDHITYLPQFSFVLPTLSVLRLFRAFGVDFKHFQEDFPSEKIDGKTKLRELSLGFRRLIEVYVLIKTTSLFTLLDEPFSYIMPLHVEKIKLLIVQYASRKGFIVSDHLYQNILEICDPINILHDGKTYILSSRDDLIKYGYISS